MRWNITVQGLCVLPFSFLLPPGGFMAAHQKDLCNSSPPLAPCSNHPTPTGQTHLLKEQKHSYHLPCSRALKESPLLSKFSKRSLASFLTFYVSLIYMFCISHLTIVILQNLSEIIPRSLS